jgi:GH15 family glucan-1,4-alpha-glucosidase
VFKRNRKSEKPLAGQRIEDYALIGDCETAALVGLNGSIDWLCWPDFQSSACFAALLGTTDHGYWKIAPKGKVKSTKRRYLPDTMIVETTFETASGTAVLVDFMPPRGKYSDVVRIVRCTRGKLTMCLELAIRFDYGRTIPWVTRFDHGLRAIAGRDMVVLRSMKGEGVKGISLEGEGMESVGEFSMKAGQEQAFTLTYKPSIGEDGNLPIEDPEAIDPHGAFDDTVNFWTEWNAKNSYKGKYEVALRRSLMTLKALTYKPSGGIVAAPTTSLPESIGGERNWDYRFCWLRDTAFTLLTLLNAGYHEEAEAWRRWLLRAIAGAPDQLQTIYGICGERQLNEWEASWLPGYENSKPVNIGNKASMQFQLDVYGEVAAALSRMPTAQDDIKLSSTDLQARLMDQLSKIWQEPDDGIWETRGGRKQFVHSKVMAWVGLDRAIKHYEKFDGGGEIKLWRKQRELIHKEVCEKGFDKKLNSFVQYYGSKQLDASCLRIGLVGFLPMDDPRIIGTIEAIEKKLMKDGFVQRYDTRKSPDGLPPGEGVFLACSFWLVMNLWLIGRKTDAEAMFERLLALQNDVGLLSEEWDTTKCRMVGNFPQAFSHITLAHAVYTLSGSWHPQGAKPVGAAADGR